MANYSVIPKNTRRGMDSGDNDKYFCKLCKKNHRFTGKIGIRHSKFID